MVELKVVIMEGDVVVATDNSKLVSFYLVNTTFHHEIVIEREKIINQMILDKMLPADKYALNLLAATDEKSLRRGLNKKTLHYLREIAKGKFDYFVGVMSHDNLATQKSPLKMGWKHFGDIGIGLLAVIGTIPESDRILANYAASVQVK